MINPKKAYTIKEGYEHLGIAIITITSRDLLSDSVSIKNESVSFFKNEQNFLLRYFNVDGQNVLDRKEEIKEK